MGGFRKKGDIIEYDESVHCGAQTRSNGPCKKVKGDGTVHPGEGRCKLHGGLQKNDGRLIGGGRYSTVRQNTRLHAILSDHRKYGPDTTKLDDELAIARGILAEALERHDEFERMLVDWHESYTGKFRAEFNELQRLLQSREPQEIAASIKRLREIMLSMPPKPTKVPDKADLVKVINAIGGLVEKIHNMSSSHQVPLTVIFQLQRDMALQMMNVAGSFLTADDVVRFGEEVARRWGQIQMSDKG